MVVIKMLNLNLTQILISLNISRNKTLIKYILKTCLDSLN